MLISHDASEIGEGQGIADKFLPSASRASLFSPRLPCYWPPFPFPPIHTLFSLPSDSCVQLMLIWVHRSWLSTAVCTAPGGWPCTWDCLSPLHWPMWWSAYLACRRPWVYSTAPREKWKVCTDQAPRIQKKSKTFYWCLVFRSTSEFNFWD